MKLPARVSPFMLLCALGGLAIFSTTMSKNPALPLFIRSLGVPEGTVGFIAAASTVVGIVVIMDMGHSAGPMVGGLLVSAFGYAAAFGSVAAVLIVTAVVFLIVVGQH